MTPRPATERLVERSLARPPSRPTTVADVGSGSGAIAIAIALRAPRAEVWAADLSGAAVELAQANVALYELAARVHVVQGDLLDGVPGGVDLVVANLPYLPAGQRAEPRWLSLAAEPPSAVFAPGDGLGPYRRLLAASEKRLAPDGALVIQYRGEVLEALRHELSGLLAELEERSLAA
jgi:release factor glutamine methyltransferase